MWIPTWTNRRPLYLIRLELHQARCGASTFFGGRTASGAGAVMFKFYLLSFILHRIGVEEADLLVSD